MCGIYGIAGRLRDGDLDVASAMDACLVHRGPDAGGSRRSRHGIFGARRLSIIDLSSGNQPISSEDGRLWVTLNGEIYNYRELRRGLEAAGHRFATSSDTEVVVHAYEAYGEAFVDRLRGMFALAVWDEANGRVLLARDRIGKKPLYFSLRNERLVYASELKAVLADPGVSGEIDREALWHYLSFKHVPAPSSIFAGVRVLPPGHVAVFSAGALELRSYWRPRFTGESALRESEAADELLATLEDAVRARVEASDVPVGAFLSGGIDSSLVVALMARYAPKPLKTFSMGYANRVAHKNDVDFARRVAAEFGTEHRELILETGDVANELPAVVEAFDEPFGGTISTYWLAREISRHVKVALSGDGADELFGSYAAHRAAALIGEIRRGDRRDEAVSMRSVRMKDAAAEPDGVWRTRFGAFTDAEKLELFEPGFGYFEPSSNLLGRLYGDASQSDLVNATLEVECRSFLPDEILTYVDRLSMAHSLEVRVPFLDQDVIAFAGRLPGTLKVRRDATKAILKTAARRVLPPEIVDRPKEGFVLPMDAWLGRDLRALCNEAFSPAWLRHGYFRRSTIDRIWSEHISGARDHTYKLWSLLMFQLWHRSYVEQRRYRASAMPSKGAA